MEVKNFSELQPSRPSFDLQSQDDEGRISEAVGMGIPEDALQYESDEDSPDEVIPQGGSRRRSGRVKVRPLTWSQSRNVGPKKLNPRSSAKDIEKYYLDKKVKRVHPSLETIFEEPGDDTMMSNRKFKRFINFSVTCSKNNPKIKKRKLKAKGVSAKTRNGKKVTLKMLMDKLAELDNDEINKTGC